MTSPNRDSLADADAEDRRDVERVLGGDEGAFGGLHRRHHGRVFGIAYGMTGSADSAQELAQETFMRAFERLGKYRGESAFGTWLHRVAVNVCLNHRARLRRPRADEAELAEVADASTPSDDALHLRRIQREVHEAILSLTPKQRIVVVLKDLQGLSYDEIAARLGCSSGTVASRLNGARRRLAVRLAHLKGAR